MHLRRRPGAFAPDRKAVVGAVGEVRVRPFTPGRQQDEASARGREIGSPGVVADQLHPVQVVEAGAPQPAVVQVEPAGLDHVDGHPQAGRQAQQGSGVLGDVRFEKDEAHGAGRSAVRGAGFTALLSRMFSSKSCPVRNRPFRQGEGSGSGSMPSKTSPRGLGDDRIREGRRAVPVVQGAPTRGDRQGQYGHGRHCESRGAIARGR